MDSASDAQIRAAAAQVSGHCRVNCFISGSGTIGEQRGRLHNLSRLTVSALGYLLLDPGALKTIAAIHRESLNGRNRLTPYRFHRR